MSTRNLIKSLGVMAILLGAVLVTGAAAESKARIVRLSDVQGSVQMDKGDGFQRAFLNLPVVEGSKLKTGDDGRAEVEFEDGTVLHVVPNSEVDFTHLALGDDGQKLTTVELKDGRAYVNFRPRKGDRFTLDFARESVTLTEPAHFRVDMDTTEATLAVFKGEVEASGPSGQVKISSKHSATFDLGNNDTYALNKNYEEDPYDNWDQQQTEYHDRYAGGSDVQSPYAYGMSDLNYYGNYINVPGYGLCWQPYFIGTGWSPFQDGGWVWYPGFGYMWVSSYPWGWMPYYYGNWGFMPGYGWFWQPGYWNTWNPMPRVVNPPARTPIPQPPIRTHTTVMVGKGLVVNPVAGPPKRITITSGSAGLGIQRGSIKNLDRVARDVRSERPVTVKTEPAARIQPMPAPRVEHEGTVAPSRGTGEVSRPAEPPRVYSPPPPPPRMSSPPPPPRSAPPPHR